MHKIIIIFLLIILLYNLNNNEGFEDYSYKNSQRRIKSLFENNNENIEYKEIINKQNYNLNK